MSQNLPRMSGSRGGILVIALVAVIAILVSGQRPAFPDMPPFYTRRDVCQRYSGLPAIPSAAPPFHSLHAPCLRRPVEGMMLRRANRHSTNGRTEDAKAVPEAPKWIIRL